MSMAAHVEYGDPQVALPNEILRPVAGSGVHGIAIAGTDDRDEMGVYIEPPEYVLGLGITGTGHLSLPLPGRERHRVLAVKRGEVPRDDVSAEIASLEAKVRALLDEGGTPLRPRRRIWPDHRVGGRRPASSRGLVTRGARPGQDGTTNERVEVRPRTIQSERGGALLASGERGTIRTVQ